MNHKIHLIKMTRFTLLLSIVLLLIINQAFAEENPSIKKSMVVSPKIEGILTSNVGNKDGYVTKNKSVFPPTKIIYVTVHISNAKPGLKVKGLIINSPKNIRSNTGVNIATIGGNIAKAFEFEYERDTWPSGVYTVEITLSTGDHMTSSVELKN